MSWFGWLTKPHCEVTGLDKIAAFLEISVVVLTISAVAYLTANRRRK